MKFDTKYIIIIAILGIILLYSYYYFFKSFKDPTKLWGRIEGNFLYIYYISMILSTIGFLFLFYYLITSNSFTIDEIHKLYYSLICILIISMFWMPVSIDYIKNKNNYNKFLIYLILFSVAMSVLYLNLILNNIKEYKNKIGKKLALIGMIYFFIHTFFFDFILWTYNFF